MKRLILSQLLIALVLLAGVSKLNAQIRNDRGTFNLPVDGDMLVETQAAINANGGGFFSLNDPFLYNLNNLLANSSVAWSGYTSGGYYPMIKLRKFMAHNMAHRLFINLSYNSRKTEDSSQDQTMTNLGIGLGMGFEKVFTPAERLNTYIGGDITFGFGRFGAKYSNSVLDAHQSGFGIGMKAFTGMDYYVLPKIYLGLELGFGLSYNHIGEVKYDSGDDGKTTSNFNMTPYITPMFRLGYVLGNKRMMHGNGEPGYRSKQSSDDDE